MAGMYNNECTVSNIHWKEGQGNAEFIILWSDYTWEIIKCPCTIGTIINNKSLKQYMSLNKIVSGHYTKEEAYNYINKKITEI